MPLILTSCGNFAEPTHRLGVRCRATTSLADSSCQTLQQAGAALAALARRLQAHGASEGRETCTRTQPIAPCTLASAQVQNCNWHGWRHPAREGEARWVKLLCAHRTTRWLTHAPRSSLVPRSSSSLALARTTTPRSSRLVLHAHQPRKVGSKAEANVLPGRALGTTASHLVHADVSCQCNAAIRRYSSNLAGATSA
jgi:hypothetical protein